MDLEARQEPITVSELRGLSTAIALPVVRTEGGEVLSACLIEENRGVLYNYSAFGGWRPVDAVSRDVAPDLESVWRRLCRNAFAGPLPDGLVAVPGPEDTGGRFRSPERAPDGRDSENVADSTWRSEP